MALGERIEDYEVSEPLGRGGFATVYRARCRNTGLEVAIKEIDKRLMESAGMVGRVRQEVSIHSRLKHPSVLELYTFFEDKNYVYLVLELCHKGELQNYLKRGSRRVLSESEAGRVMSQVVEGVRYLHSHNILHRDISLSNLLLTGDMRVKIADFGLAAQLSTPDERHVTMCGTPNFISPEVASRALHGLEADVWGLGCLLYTLLVGTPPFDARAVRSTLTRVIAADYVLPPYLSSRAKHLIDRMLKKNPQERITLRQIARHPFLVDCESLHDSGVYASSSRLDRAPYLSDCSTRASVDISRDISGGSTLEEYGKPRVHKTRSTSDLPLLYTRDDCTRAVCNQRARACGSLAAFRSDSIKTETQVVESVRRSAENGPAPLSCYRLAPTRHATKNVVLWITDSREVCLEFVRATSHSSGVYEILKISVDGSRICVYRPRHDLSVNAANPLPIPVRSDSHRDYLQFYHLQNLPNEYWKKYSYAAKFVDLVKAKTPKVTFYGDEAKCLLMENLNSFEVNFYCGARIIESSIEGITFYDETGKDGTTLKSVNEIFRLSDSLRSMWDRSRTLRQHCLLLEKTLGQVPGDNFPVIVGRRPNNFKTTPL